MHIQISCENKVWAAFTKREEHHGRSERIHGKNFGHQSETNVSNGQEEVIVLKFSQINLNTTYIKKN